MLRLREWRGTIASFPALHRRSPQSDNDIVQMFLVPSPRIEPPKVPADRRPTRGESSARAVDDRFIRILKIFKRDPDSERALEVLMLKMDYRLVREVMNTDVDIDVKVQFFKWAGYLWPLSIV